MNGTSGLTACPIKTDLSPRLTPRFLYHVHQLINSCLWVCMFCACVFLRVRVRGCGCLCVCGMCGAVLQPGNTDENLVKCNVTDMKMAEQIKIFFDFEEVPSPARVC